jgi:DNA polymerase-3 subunit alpha
METVRDSVVAGLKGRLELDRFYLEVLGREMALYESEVHLKFFDALGACLEFARSRSLRIGPGRGSASSSLLMFGLGLTEVDPVAESLIPERLSMLPLEIHIDVVTFQSNWQISF